jgi:hypothetical protein
VTDFVVYDDDDSGAAAIFLVTELAVVAVKICCGAARGGSIAYKLRTGFSFVKSGSFAFKQNS